MPKIKGGRATQAAAPAPDAPVAKKKRNTNPGVRHQGGRVYDSENGTTCHQCRQKTIEIKAKCRTCSFHFCPKCMDNRYFEDVAAANAAPAWACPRCRGICNCSNCRKKAGLAATGILANVAKSAGFESVSALLQKNPKAQALNMLKGGDAGASGSRPAPPKPAPRPKRPAGERPKRKLPEDDGLVDDSQLGPRPAPMPAAQPLALHKAAGGGGGGGGAKRQRPPAWLERLPPAAPLPPDVDPSQLACILEFVAVFGGPALGMRAPPPLAALAAELAQPPAPRRADQLCRVPEDSAVAALHARLLGMVRAAWEVAGGSGPAAWQAQMGAYYAAELLPPGAQRALREARGEHLPAAVAGEMYVRPEDSEQEVEEGGGGGHGGGGGGAGRARGGVAAAASADYPEGGYWGLAPGLRVAMLYALVHDALDVHAVRAVVEAGLGGAAAGDRARRTELVAARREAREEAARQRDREIALIIAGGGGQGMTLEQQRQVVGEATARAGAAAAAAAAAKVSSLTGAVAPAAVRAAPLGQDREGRLVFALQAGPALTGRPDGLIALPGSDEAPQRAVALPDPAAVARALDPKGRREGPLRHAIAATCKLSPAALDAAAAPGAKAAGLASPLSPAQKKVRHGVAAPGVAAAAAAGHASKPAAERGGRRGLVGALPV